MENDIKLILCEEIAKNTMSCIWSHKNIIGTHALGKNGASLFQNQIRDFLLNHADFDPKAEPEPLKFY